MSALDILTQWCSDLQGAPGAHQQGSGAGARGWPGSPEGHNSHPEKDTNSTSQGPSPTLFV